MADSFIYNYIISGVARSFEKGNPRYIAGLSGSELATGVLYRTEGQRPYVTVSAEIGKSPEYWSGWIFACYHWYTAYSFSYLQNRGLTLSRILSLYPTLHEADVSKFVSVADGIIEKSKKESISNVQRIRKAKGITQKQLAEMSGTSLHMVRLCEQKQQDIRKA